MDDDDDDNDGGGGGDDAWGFTASVAALDMVRWILWSGFMAIGVPTTGPVRRGRVDCSVVGQDLFNLNKSRRLGRDLCRV